MDLNVSDISLFAMKPPYKPCAANSEPVSPKNDFVLKTDEFILKSDDFNAYKQVLLKDSSGISGGWSQYSVDFSVTVTSSQELDNQARISYKWLFFCYFCIQIRCI